MKTQPTSLKAKYNMIGEVRGKGLMTGIELIRDQNKTPANTEGSKIRDFCLGKGLLIGLGGVLWERVEDSASSCYFTQTIRPDSEDS